MRENKGLQYRRRSVSVFRMKTEALPINKLPRWAQRHIEELQRQRDEAVRELNEWVDHQTPSPIFINEYVGIGEQRGPSEKRRYIQGRGLSIEWQGVSLDILLAKDDSQRDDGIEIRWGGERRLSGSMVAMIPKSFQMVSLVAKENMR